MKYDFVYQTVNEKVNWPDVVSKLIKCRHASHRNSFQYLHKPTKKPMILVVT